jgi:hypothetical protein
MYRFNDADSTMENGRPGGVSVTPGTIVSAGVQRVSAIPEGEQTLYTAEIRIFTDSNHAFVYRPRPQ